jgi:hypothetical protein
MAWGLLAAAVSAMGQGASGGAPMPAITIDGLAGMGPAGLDQLYRQSPAGTVPRGRVRGRALPYPGTRLAPAASRASRLVWQGKVFDPDAATAVNRFFGVRMIRGNVSQGPSWLDGRPSLILDYQGTSLVYGRYRDEIREVAPGVYLGLMYERRGSSATLTRYFAFEAVP